MRALVLAFVGAAAATNCTVPGAPTTAQIEQARGIVQQMEGLAIWPDLRLKLTHKVYGPDGGWEAGFTETAIKEYTRFMALSHVFGEAVPSKAIDEVWHSHIIDTRRYAGDCQRIFGRFLHHYPYFGLGGKHGDHAALMAKYTRTLTRYVNIFRELPSEDIWGKIRLSGGVVPSQEKVSCCGMFAQPAQDSKPAQEEKVSCCGMFAEAAQDEKVSCCGMFNAVPAQDEKVSCCGMFNAAPVQDEKVSCCGMFNAVPTQDEKVSCCGMFNAVPTQDEKVSCCGMFNAVPTQEEKVSCCGMFAEAAQDEKVSCCGMFNAVPAQDEKVSCCGMFNAVPTQEEKVSCCGMFAQPAQDSKVSCCGMFNTVPVVFGSH
eukprot:TRINITY_DN181_c0_g1_i3.p1 TRINITY_DN181_c0_g1~~TRINITY_DN181_c0_g1_i3.p1  ORF type:complete len:372 (+),score=134.37 TRINITY_DN181_c0_g1_i3:76-1191(+)